MDVQRFYNLISGEYTQMLERLVPRYREMLWMILDYIPPEVEPKHILELGTGTGNLTQGLLNKYPEAQITGVDLSAQILEEAAKRLQPNQTVSFLNEDFRALKLANNSVDLVVSSIALHHLTDAEKQTLLQNIFGWLKPGGVLIFGDQFAGSTAQRYQHHIAHWKAEAKNIPEKEWQLWMEHQEKHDYHTTIENYMQWCQHIGFTNSDVVWRYLLWTVFITHKA